MRAQVNIIFDLETEADRATVIARIQALVSAVGVDAAVVPLPGNGAAAPEPPPPDEQRAKDQAAANLKARQQAAAQARAAKANKASPPPADAAADLGGTNGADPDDDDGLGLTTPSMSPAEAKDAGLALVREAYSAGHVAQVKALQKELGVAKFYDVEVTDGHAFYQRVMKLAHETGIRR